MSLAFGSRAKRVVSLEAFIIDTIIHEDSTRSQDDQMGGSGTYAMVGARIFLPPSRLGMIINYSHSTLPEWMRDRLKSYGDEMWYFKERQDGLGTTRSVQTYMKGVRTETLVDEVLCNPVDLLDTAFRDPLPTTIHMTSVLDRTQVILEQIEQISKSAKDKRDPVVVWEPYYADSIPANFDMVRTLMPLVDILSPNHIEALCLCSITTSGSSEAIETACVELAKLRPKRAVVIRAGAMGACYALSTSPHEVRWVPAYWTEAQIDQVVDVTGAGNGFLGGLCAALDEDLDIHDAVVWGSVAASFIVQQVGLPVLTTSKDGSEMWNGISVQERIDDLNSRSASKRDPLSMH